MSEIIRTPAEIGSEIQGSIVLAIEMDGGMVKKGKCLPLAVELITESIFELAEKVVDEQDENARLRALIQRMELTE